ncbi:ABC transporter substrate-binding protein [Lacrimispora sp. 210928-DFI.3.58]|uniref:ABC transporter substrate-binding protein n=1 Tax=Lacrimispora sp. 210928-DFI.3.58 TaxID=2883214 RepID=UPI001D07D486|nr:ABC transporter substrate-binding protein [Lacrimispora sp. 210928-DFI.3.58]MCB7320353.1 ABC transporter substrate-binding protein [Lacrimispora sp. 210928-DFI.3.58]
MKWGKHMKKYFSKIAASLMAAAIMSMTLNGCSSSSSNANSGSAASSANAVNTNNSDSLENQNGEKQIVKVGVMCPLSGTSSRFGELYKASIDSAMKVINEDDLLKDYILEFEYVDDKGSTDGAPIAASYVLDQYGAHVSIGHLLTTMILVSGPMFDEAEVPLLGIVSGPASVAQGFQYLCIETSTDLVQAETLLKYLVEEKGYTKLSMIHINTEGGTSAADHIEKVLKEKYDLELVTKDSITGEDSDFTAQVLKMKDGGAEVVIVWGLVSGQSNVLQKNIEQNWGNVPEDVLVAGGTSMAQRQVAEVWEAKDLQGVVFPVGYIPDESNPDIVRYINNFREFDPLGQDPADVPARVYDSVFHIVTALNNLGPYDVNADDFSIKLNEQLRNASFDGVQGHFDYSAFDDGEGLMQVNIGEWGEDYSQTKIYP